MTVPSSTVEERRRLSSSLFGARYRLEICGSLNSGEQVTTSDLESRLGDVVPRSSIHVEVKHLREAGLLKPVSKQGGSRFVYLEVAKSPFWDAIRTLMQDPTMAKGSGK